MIFIVVPTTLETSGMYGLSYPPPHFASYIFLICNNQIKYHFPVSVSTNTASILIFLIFPSKPHFLWYHRYMFKAALFLFNGIVPKSYFLKLFSVPRIWKDTQEIYTYKYMNILLQYSIFLWSSCLASFLLQRRKFSTSRKRQHCSLMSCGRYISCGSTYPPWKAKWQAEIC